MEKTLVLYEKEDDLGKHAAETLRLILGPARALERKAEDVLLYEMYEVIIFCYPLDEKKRNKVYDFLKKQQAWLMEKKIMNLYFAEHSKQPRLYFSDIYSEFEQHEKELKMAVIDTQIISIDTQKEAMTEISIMIPLYKAAMEFKKKKESTNKQMPMQELKIRIEEFMSQHNTCTLATGDHDTIRATPIEFIYMDMNFYFLSEGGEKFEHILKNNNVAISIYNEYTTMKDLNSLQVKGIASILPIGSKIYELVLEKKGLTAEKLSKLPVDMNMIKVKAIEMEFLCSYLKKEGYSAKQILCL